MRAVQYLKHVHTCRGNKKSLQPIRSKAMSLMHGFPRWAPLHVSPSYVSFIAFFAFPLVIASILQQSLENRWPQLKHYLCEKMELSVTYQICSFLFSAHFVETMSKALQIPKWRIFNVWTEEGDEDGCLIVKFGIIGTGNPALSRQLHCGLPLLWSFLEYQTGKHVTSHSSDRVTVQYYSRAFPVVHSSYKVSRSSEIAPYSGRLERDSQLKKLRASKW